MRESRLWRDSRNLYKALEISQTVLHEYDRQPGHQQIVETANGSNGRVVNGRSGVSNDCNGLRVSHHRIVLNPGSTPPKDGVQGGPSGLGQKIGYFDFYHLSYPYPIITVAYTGLPAYSDSAGTTKKCHCNQKAPYFVTVSKPVLL